MKPIEIDETNFEAEVIQSEEPVLVDFWASWCGPCRMLSPIVEEIAESAEGFKVGKVDCDNNQALCQKYNITSIPTLIVFRNGEAVKKSVGAIPKQRVLDLLK